MTGSGELYTWGKGDAGQLGHGDDNGKAEPKLVAPAMFSEGIRSVDCGALQTIALGAYLILLSLPSAVCPQLFSLN